MDMDQRDLASTMLENLSYLGLGPDHAVTYGAPPPGPDLRQSTKDAAECTHA